MSPTKRLNEQLRRNRKRFPDDFAFQVSAPEDEILRSQIATLKESEADTASKRSQIATLKGGRGQHRKYRPWVFTEHGALQVANILRSDHAIAMSVYVIRAFVELREKVATNAAILKRLTEIDKALIFTTALCETFTKNSSRYWRLRQNLLAGKSAFLHRHKPLAMPGRFSARLWSRTLRDSARAAESLQKMGYKNVRSMACGFKAWKAIGLPTTK